MAIHPNAWLNAAMRSEVVKRSATVSVLVGTILVAINQSGVLLSGEFSADLLWRIPLTYLVPYCVSTYASVDAILTARDV